MYSGAVKEQALASAQRPARELPSERWTHFPFSEIGHHGEACCDLAREWVGAMDASQLNGGSVLSGPRSLRERYDWGPSAWPIHWCEVVARKIIDCGAHSALAHEAFTARGLTAYRAQFVQRYSADAMEEWRRKWRDEEVSDHWLGETGIYHEGNAVLVKDDEVRLWDGSAASWLNLRQGTGYGSLLSVRIFAPERSNEETFCWGEHRIAPNLWYSLDMDVG